MKPSKIAREETGRLPCPCSFCVDGNCTDPVHVYYQDQVRRIADFAALVVKSSDATQKALGLSPEEINSLLQGKGAESWHEKRAVRHVSNRK